MSKSVPHARGGEHAAPGDQQRLYEAKARAELVVAERLIAGSDRIAWRGSLIPEVAVIKGRPGPAEASGGKAVSGKDGDAIAKALEALGYEPREAFFALSDPVDTAEGAARAQRLRAIIEAVDAPLVIALDGRASEDLGEAFACGALAPGVAVRAGGRRLLAVDDFESSLQDPVAKKRAWRQLAAARRS